MPAPFTQRDAVASQLISEVLQLSGAASLRVFGSSMLPCILPQDILSIRREEFRRIKKGDVVLFARDNRLFAHRVLYHQIIEGLPTLMTRGDSLIHDDAPVSPHELLGRVISIQRRARHLSPRATFFSRPVSILLRHICLLKTCLLWLLCRIGFSGPSSAREVSECLT